MALDLVAGIVSLATALGFLGVLIYKVWSIPLWIVILAGRGDDGGERRSRRCASEERG